MTYNLKDVIVDELTGKAELVDEQTYINRISECEQCEHGVSLIPLAGKSCKLCGCFIKAKARYRQSQCPDHPPRWLAVKLSKK